MIIKIQFYILLKIDTIKEMGKNGYNIYKKIQQQSFRIKTKTLV